MLLGIVIHALQAYAMMCFRPGSGTPGGIWLAEFIHAWRMPLFFLVSGFFCRMMFLRYGPARYLQRRWQRIGIPLLLGLVTVSPLFVFTHEQVKHLQVKPTRMSAGGEGGSGALPTDLPSPSVIARKFDANHDGRIDEAERKAVERYFQDGFGFVPPPPGTEAGGVEHGTTSAPQREGASAIGREMGQRRHGGPAWVFRHFGGFIRDFRWFALHYLWFLWYLILFVVAGPVLAGAAGRLAVTPAGEGLERLGALTLKPGLAAVLLAAVTMPLLWAQGGWSLTTSMALLLPFPLFVLQPDPAILGFHFVYFASGWFLHRCLDSLQVLAQRWMPLLFVGVAAYVASRFAAGDLPPGPQPSAAGADPAKRLLVLSLYSGATAFLTIGWIGFFQRFFDRPSSRWRYVSDATFWLYLAHQPLVLVLQAALTHLRGPWFIQVPVVVAVATILLLLIYRFGVRDKLIGRILNGPRRHRAPSTAIPIETRQA